VVIGSENTRGGLNMLHVVLISQKRVMISKNLLDPAASLIFNLEDALDLISRLNEVCLEATTNL
jgi:hypothetical protein